MIALYPGDKMILYRGYPTDENDLKKFLNFSDGGVGAIPGEEDRLEPFLKAF